MTCRVLAGFAKGKWYPKAHTLQEIKRECGQDLSGNTKARRQLQTAAETAKITLSASDTAFIEVDGVLNGRDFRSKITRARFEDLCRDIFERCIRPAEKCLEEADMDADDIDEVVLVGGSTRIPKIQHLLRELFQGKSLNKSVNPDEAVACGAAVQAALLTNTYHPKLQRLSVQDVTPLPLGVRVFPGVVSVVVPKNTPTPVRISRDQYSNLSQYCSSITFCVHEGQEEMARATPESLIGEFTVHDLPRGPPGSQQYEVTFQIDENNMLTVTGMHAVTRQAGEITIDHRSRRITDAEKQEMKSALKKHNQASQMASASRKSRFMLAEYAGGVLRALEAGLRDVLASCNTDPEILEKAAQEVEGWLQSSGTSDAMSMLEKKKEELVSIAEEILQEARQSVFLSGTLPHPFEELGVPVADVFCSIFNLGRLCLPVTGFAAGRSLYPHLLH